MKRLSIWKRYGFAWVTGALFIITLTGHWIFGWFAYPRCCLAYAVVLLFLAFARRPDFEDERYASSIVFSQ